jgi:agmatinase
LATGEVSSQITVIGLPFDGAVSFRAGAARAPARIREVSRTADPVSRRARVVPRGLLADHGDIPPSGTTAEYFAEVRRRIASLPGDPIVVALGGDNSVSIPALQAFVDRHGDDVGVIWFDAHPDLFKTYDDNPDSHACALRTAMARARIRPEHVVLAGVRSFAEVELAYLAERGLRAITAAEWLASGSERVADEIAGRVGGRRAVYFAIDIDGFDASVAPGTGYPMPAGIDAETFFLLVEGLFARSVPIRAVDITEVAPPLDHNDITSFLAAQIVLEMAALVSGATGWARALT